MIGAYFEEFNILRWLDFGDLGVCTNMSVMICMSLGVVGCLWGTRLIPRRWQVMVELIHSNMRGLVEESLGQLGTKYFPFVLSIFTMLAVLNLLGLCPYVFTPTVHIAMTLGIAVSVMAGVTVLGVKKFGLNYLSILVPGGIPLVISPFLIVVETASYLIRAISLGVRLAANISAGHLLFSILGTFAFDLWMKGFIWLGWGAAVILVCITFLEIMVAVIQAYVFSLLVTIYLRDTIFLH